MNLLPIFLCLLSSLLFGGAWPTYGMSWLLFIAFIPLLWTEHLLTTKKPNKKKLVFLYSWLSFLIWNSITTYWLIYAKRPDGSNSLEAFFAPLVFNSFFMTIVFWLFSWSKNKIGEKTAQFFFIVLWLSFEKLHHEWELAWPWLSLGNGFATSYKWIQWYEYTGISGGTWWVLVINFGLFNLSKAYFYTKSKKILYRGLLFNGLKILIPIFISYLIYFNYKEKGNSYEFLVLQPNVESYKEKYIRSDKDLINELVSLTKKHISPKTSFVLAPETALPGKEKIFTNALKDKKYIYKIKDALKNTQAVFITGAELFSLYYSKEESTPSAFPINGSASLWMDIFNSAIQISPEKEKIQIYHKSKLVPGVEIFPYQRLLKPIVGNILLNFGGSSLSHGRQKEASVFSHPSLGIKVAPVICYESVFGEYVASYIQKGAHFIAIVTNDSWWGDSQGYKQHLCYARLRAIENRRAVARSANTGVSAFINQRGDFIAQLLYNQKGALRMSIQANTKKTFYSLYGDFISRIAMLLAGILFAYALAYKLMLSKKRK